MRKIKEKKRVWVLPRASKREITRTWRKRKSVKVCTVEIAEGRKCEDEKFTQLDELKVDVQLRLSLDGSGDAEQRGCRGCTPHGWHGRPQ
jgi:hypothetical protein